MSRQTPARRVALVAAGWLVAASAATLTGVGAVSVIGAGITGSDEFVMSEDDVLAVLATTKATETAGPTSGTTGPTPSEPAPSASGTAPTDPGPAPSEDPQPDGQLTGVTPGGSVVARCEGPNVFLVY
nr:hypothetical protein [Micromonospora sp. DSM 115978]